MPISPPPTLPGLTLSPRPDAAVPRRDPPDPIALDTNPHYPPTARFERNEVVAPPPPAPRLPDGESVASVRRSRKIYLISPYLRHVYIRFQAGKLGSPPSCREGGGRGKDQIYVLMYSTERKGTGHGIELCDWIFRAESACN